MNFGVSQRMPYPGLRAFRRDESDLFFGREDCINTIVDRLAATHFLAVLGSSGTGKSSVVKTGLLDALDLGLMAEARSTWRVVDFRPGSAPLRNLACRILEIEHAETGGTLSDSDVDLLRAFLMRGPRSVIQWCGEGHLPHNTNLLLLVDQFEELFRYQDYAGREEAEAFTKLLLESTRTVQLPIYVALTMRSEYLGACALIEGLAEAISAGLFLTPRMTRDQCRAAIVGPAGVCGIQIEEALVNRLLNDLAAFAPWDDRGSVDQLDRLVRRADQLPMLQYCLNRVCVRARDQPHREDIVLSLADYERIGGLGGALNVHADEILSTLGDGRQSVAEGVFRAVMEGSTIADAVRRPTRFGELVAVCGGDEPVVRAVVDTFRSPGCNFLTPEFVPKNPAPISVETFIDISHESLIRQWKKMSDWLESEARGARQWRRLKDRFEDGQLMTGAELANTLAWRDEQMPNAVWARRYGGDFPAMINFLERSEQARRRFAPLTLPFFWMNALVTTALLIMGLTAFVYGIPEHWPWPFTIGLFSVAVASTCAFALWRYTDLEVRRAVLAGITICVLVGTGGAALIIFLMWHHVTESSALNFWGGALLAPCTLIGMAIFEPIFRKLFPWILLISSLAVPILRIGEISTTEETKTIMLLVVFLCWFSIIGYQVRQGSQSFANVETRRRFALVELPALGLVIYVVSISSSEIILAIIYGSANQPQWWLVNLGLLSASTAITLAFGLRRYSGLPRQRAVLAGGTLFLLELTAGAVLMTVLVSRNVAWRDAFHLWEVFLYAPCALSVMATFERAFRSVKVWIMLVVLFALPWGGVVWLHDTSLISIREDVFALSILTILSVWFAAIGYHMRGTSRRPAKLAEAKIEGLAFSDPRVLEQTR